MMLINCRSLFSEIQQAPPVEVFKLTADYNADSAENKVSSNSGAGLAHNVLHGKLKLVGCRKFPEKNLSVK